MVDLYKNIRLKREQLGMSQDDLAGLVGYTSRTSIAKIEGGKIDLPQSKVELFAHALHTTPAELLGWEVHKQELPSIDNLMPIQVKRLPILGEIACGEPIYASEDHENYILAGSDIDADFCLRAKGESMINARIWDGDIVFIRAQPQVENGEIAAVIIGDEATLKRVYYYPQQNRLMLNAENPAFAPLIYIGDELRQIKILGKAVAFQSNVK